MNCRSRAALEPQSWPILADRTLALQPAAAGQMAISRSAADSSHAQRTIHVHCAYQPIVKPPGPSIALSRLTARERWSRALTHASALLGRYVSVLARPSTLPQPAVRSSAHGTPVLVVPVARLLRAGQVALKEGDGEEAYDQHAQDDAGSCLAAHGSCAAEISGAKHKVVIVSIGRNHAPT